MSDPPFCSDAKREKRARDIERAGVDRVTRCDFCGGYAEDETEFRDPICFDCARERWACLSADDYDWRDDR